MKLETEDIKTFRMALGGLSYVLAKSLIAYKGDRPQWPCGRTQLHGFACEALLLQAHFY